MRLVRKLLITAQICWLILKRTCLWSIFTNLHSSPVTFTRLYVQPELVTQIMFFSMSNKVTKREENKYKIKNEWPKIGLNASKEFKFDIEL